MTILALLLGLLFWVCFDHFALFVPIVLGSLCCHAMPFRRHEIYLVPCQLKRSTCSGKLWSMRIITSRARVSSFDMEASAVLLEGRDEDFPRIPPAGHVAVENCVHLITLLCCKILLVTFDGGGPASCVSRSQVWGRVLVYQPQPPAISHYRAYPIILELFHYQRRAPVCYAGLRRFNPGTQLVFPYRFSHEFVRVQTCPVYRHLYLLACL